MTRYDFGAIAQVIDLRSREDLIAVTRDLSLAGCFIKTRTPFPAGTEVRVRITYAGLDFAAIGYVTGNINLEGMGIEFVEMAPKDQAIIEEWLTVTALTDIDPDIAAEVLPRQVRLKNRLGRQEQNRSVTCVDRKPEAERPRPLAKELFASARNLLKFRDEAQR